MNDAKLGIMGSDPDTGECLAVFSGEVPQEEVADMMSRGLLVQRKALGDVKEAFLETHPSRRVSQLGESLGRYLDNHIHAWYETADGRRHEYVGICGSRPDFDTLTSGQSVLAPGLLYQEIEMVWAAVQPDGKLRAMHSSRPDSADTLEAFRVEHVAYAEIKLMPRSIAMGLPLVEADK